MRSLTKNYRLFVLVVYVHSRCFMVSPSSWHGSSMLIHCVCAADRVRHCFSLYYTDLWLVDGVAAATPEYHPHNITFSTSGHFPHFRIARECVGWISGCYFGYWAINMRNVFSPMMIHYINNKKQVAAVLKTITTMTKRTETLTCSFTSLAQYFFQSHQLCTHITYRVIKFWFSDTQLNLKKYIRNLRKRTNEWSEEVDEKKNTKKWTKHEVFFILSIR